MVQFLNLPAYQAQNPLNFSPITQALQENQQNALAQQRINQDTQRLGFEKQRVGFEADRLKMAQSADARAGAMHGPQLQMLNEQIAHLRQQGANEAQLAPLTRQAKEIEIKLLQSKAEGKDTETMIMRSLGLGEQPAAGSAQPQPSVPPQSPIQPQSYGGGGPNMTPIPINALSGPQPAPAPVPPMSRPQYSDPNIQPIDNPGQLQSRPQQPGQPMTPAQIIGGMSPSERTQFGLSWIGKDKAAGVLKSAEDRQNLSKEARNELDKKELNTTESLARLGNIADTYKPEFLTWKTQAAQGAYWLKGKITGKLTPEQAASRQGYETFKSDTLTNLNQYIKEITGAAMTESEAKRIIGTMPNMEDDPAGFEAKLNNVRKNSALAIARYRYMRENNFKGQPWDVGRAESVMPIQKMEQTIRERAAQHYKEIKGAAPNAGDAEVYGAVKARIAREFGIDA